MSEYMTKKQIEDYRRLCRDRNTGDGSVCYVRDWCENSCESGNPKFRQMKMEFRYNLGGSDAPLILFLSNTENRPLCY